MCNHFTCRENLQLNKGYLKKMFSMYDIDFILFFIPKAKLNKYVGSELAAAALDRMVFLY